MRFDVKLADVADARLAVQLVRRDGAGMYVLQRDVKLWKSCDAQCAKAFERWSRGQSNTSFGRKNKHAATLSHGINQSPKANTEVVWR